MKNSGLINVLAVGVGGQGIIRLSDVLAAVAFDAGHDVKKSEIHGMAQRGGSVTSHIRWGSGVHSPVIMEGSAHFIVGMEELETLRNAHVLRTDGTIILNDFRVLPTTVVSGAAEYPEDMDARLAAYGKVERIPANTIAEGLGNVRASNTVLLGALSRHLDVPESIWTAVIEKSFPPRQLDLNQQAFARGRQFQPEVLPRT